jgi:RNA polymerase sigma factor (sigma-70 family)
MKKEKKQVNLISGEDALEKIPSADYIEDIEDEVELTMKKERVFALLQKLPDSYRTVIMLYYIEEKKYTEMSESLGVALGTVKTQLFRAKSSLRKLYLEEYGCV